MKKKNQIDADDIEVTDTLNTITEKENTITCSDIMESCLFMIFGQKKTVKKYKNIKLTTRQATTDDNTTVLVNTANEKIKLIDAHIDRLTKNKSNFENGAKTHYKNSDKPRAVEQLKLAKLYSQKIDGLRNTKFNLVNFKENFIVTEIQTDSISLLNEGSNEMAGITEYIEKLNPDMIADKIQESVELLTDVTKIFVTDDYDEDELLAELDDMVNPSQESEKPPIAIPVPTRKQRHDDIVMTELKTQMEAKKKMLTKDKPNSKEIGIKTKRTLVPLDS